MGASGFYVLGFRFRVSGSGYGIALSKATRLGGLLTIYTTTEQLVHAGLSLPSPQGFASGHGTAYPSCSSTQTVSEAFRVSGCKTVGIRTATE